MMIVACVSAFVMQVDLPKNGRDRVRIKETMPGNHLLKKIMSRAQSASEISINK